MAKNSPACVHDPLRRRASSLAVAQRKASQAADPGSEPPADAATDHALSFPCHDDLEFPVVKMKRKLPRSASGKRAISE